MWSLLLCRRLDLVITEDAKNQLAATSGEVTDDGKKGDHYRSAQDVCYGKICS